MVLSHETPRTLVSSVALHERFLSLSGRRGFCEAMQTAHPVARRVTWA